MKNNAFKYTLYGGLLMIVAIVTIFTSIVYHVYNYVSPKLPILNKVEETQQQDSVYEVEPTLIVETESPKFEVIEKYPKVDSQPKISVKPIVEDKLKKTIKVDTIKSDTSSIRTNKIRMVIDTTD